jgi:hypothetical protein
MMSLIHFGTAEEFRIQNPEASRKQLWSSSFGLSAGTLKRELQLGACNPSLAT